jgi:hypothetical protein
MINKLIFTTIILSTLIGCQPADEPQIDQSQKEQKISINNNSISVSGISSGGYMATQYHIAHSETVSGVGIIAAGPYWCAQGSISKALGACMKGGDMEIELLHDNIKQFQEQQIIDNTAHLKTDKVWIFHGAKDIIMANSVSQAAKELYSEYTDSENITEIYDVPVNHGMPTLSTGIKCDAIGLPFLNSCNYDAAGEIFKSFYGKLNDRVEAIGQLIKVDQSEYKDAQFTDFGYLYIPSNCKKNKTCQLHAVFHGCLQSAQFLGNEFVKGAGYNEWAESNNIIVFYPQIKSSKMSPMNPKGCWDWWGYTDQNYANKNGPQISAIKHMVDKIIETYL